MNPLSWKKKNPEKKNYLANSYVKTSDNSVLISVYDFIVKNYIFKKKQTWTIP